MVRNEYQKLVGAFLNKEITPIQFQRIMLRAKTRNNLSQFPLAKIKAALAVHGISKSSAYYRSFLVVVRDSATMKQDHLFRSLLQSLPTK